MVAQGLVGLLVPMRCQIVEYDDSFGRDLWYEHLADESCKGRAIHRALDDHGTISASWVRPAISVCVPQFPNGMSIVKR